MPLVPVRALKADVLAALGGDLVHAVRAFDGEGAVVLHWPTDWRAPSWPD